MTIRISRTTCTNVCAPSLPRPGDFPERWRKSPARFVMPGCLASSMPLPRSSIADWPSSKIQERRRQLRTCWARCCRQKTSQVNIATKMKSGAEPGVLPSSKVRSQGILEPARPMGHAWLGLLLLCATLVAYLPAIRGGLLWDDNAHVTRADLQSLLGLWRIWFQLGATQQYYPLLHSAFWVEHRLWGDATVGYHLVNVVLHAAAACLFALVLHRLSMRGAWLGAFIFALHPVCVESVAWISEQKNTLSTVFYLSAMLVYLRHDEESNGETREALPGRWQRNRARTRFLRRTPHY